MTGHDTNWHELTGFQRDLLKAVLRLSRNQSSVSGQQILRHLEGEHGTSINHGRLYPNLDTLIDYGLVEKGTIDERTNDYAATARARELVRREVQSWVDLLDADRQLMADGGRRQGIEILDDGETMRIGDDFQDIEDAIEMAREIIRVAQEAGFDV